MYISVGWIIFWVVLILCLFSEGEHYCDHDNEDDDC